MRDKPPGPEDRETGAILVWGVRRFFVCVRFCACTRYRLIAQRSTIA
jgi:hypothetical protein